MNEPEGFLSRWSRKKREAAKHEVEAVDDPSARPRDSGGTAPAHPPETAYPESKSLDSSPGLARGLGGNERGIATESRQVPHESRQEPELDLSQLPSLDDITAETDIRPFLARGVPASLRQAALRRMWVADPKIRDFIGIAENQWDFTVQGATPGFDLAPPTGDVARMVADMFAPNPVAEPASETEKPENASREAVADSAETGPPDQIGVNSAEAAARGSANEAAHPSQTVRRTQIADTAAAVGASQHDNAPQDVSEAVVRRPHGRAMPK